MSDNERNGGRVTPRRDFMVRAMEALAALGLLPLMGRTIFAAGAGPRVCLAQSGKPLNPADDVRKIIGTMLDEGIKYVSGGSDAAGYWKTNFKPSDKVAVKLSAVIDREINFGPQIAEVLVDRLAAAGVKKENIVFFERETRSLKKAGYKTNIDGPGPRFYGNNEHGYSDRESVSGKFKGKFCKTLENSTALINLPLLKTHSLSGISVAMKNHYGSFDKPNLYHANSCDPFIADLNMADEIRKKHRLVICDAMRVLYAAGPEYGPEYTADFNGMLIGIDPVAVDTCGLNIIRKLRKKSSQSRLPYWPDPIHIATAGKKGLGEADFKKIDFKVITV